MSIGWDRVATGEVDDIHISQAVATRPGHMALERIHDSNGLDHNHHALYPRHHHRTRLHHWRQQSQAQPTAAAVGTTATEIGAQRRPVRVPLQQRGEERLVAGETRRHRGRPRPRSFRSDRLVGRGDVFIGGFGVAAAPAATLDDA